MTEPELVVELDLSKMILAEEPEKTRYCAEHDFYSLPNVPCFYCEKDRVREEHKKHWPKQKFVNCVDCGSEYLTYWGSKPYTCKTCLPNEQHLANLAEFMRELES